MKLVPWSGQLLRLTYLDLDLMQMVAIETTERQERGNMFVIEMIQHNGEQRGSLDLALNPEAGIIDKPFFTREFREWEMYKDDVPFLRSNTLHTHYPGHSASRCRSVDAEKGLAFTFSYQSCKYDVTRPVVQVEVEVNKRLCNDH